MVRHYYISDDLYELEQVEKELVSEGFLDLQLHVVAKQKHVDSIHDLPEIETVFNQDLLKSTELGAIMGTLGAIFTIVVAYFLGLTSTNLGWGPVLIVAFIVFGFCTWEAGFVGIQRKNINFKRFKQALKRGKHILFVDADIEQEPCLSNVVCKHPRVIDLGTGYAMHKFSFK